MTFRYDGHPHLQPADQPGGGCLTQDVLGLCLLFMFLQLAALHGPTCKKKLQRCLLCLRGCFGFYCCSCCCFCLQLCILDTQLLLTSADHWQHPAAAMLQRCTAASRSSTLCCKAPVSSWPAEGAACKCSGHLTPPSVWALCHHLLQSYARQKCSAVESATGWSIMPHM